MKSNQLITEYLAAFAAANKISEPPDVSYEAGWFTLKGPRQYPRKYRKQALERMRDTLLERARLEDSL